MEQVRDAASAISSVNGSRARIRPISGFLCVCYQPEDASRAHKFLRASAWPNGRSGKSLPNGICWPPPTPTFLVQCEKSCSSLPLLSLFSFLSFWLWTVSPTADDSRLGGGSGRKRRKRRERRKRRKRRKRGKRGKRGRRDVVIGDTFQRPLRRKCQTNPNQVR